MHVVTKYVCTNACMYAKVITLCSRVWTNRVRFTNQSCWWSAEQEERFFFFPCPRSRLRIGFHEPASAVPSRVTLLTLHTQLTHGITSFPLSATASIYLHRQPSSSGQSGVYEVIMQLRTDGVPSREASGAGPVSI